MVGLEDSSLLLIGLSPHTCIVISVKNKHQIRKPLCWLPYKNLTRRKTKPVLTSYGHKRLRKNQTHLVEAFGEEKSVNAWANDSRCVVSDKVLKKRLDNKWKPEVAIVSPRNQVPLT